MVDALKEGEIVTVPEAQALEEDLFILRRHEATSSKILVAEVPNKSSAIKWKSYEPEYKKNNVIRELLDNFHWEIVKARKSMNLSRKQLADAIGTNEQSLRMLENGELPSDDFILINKVQNRLKINLRKDGKSFSDAPLRPAPNPNEVTLSSLQRAKEMDKKLDSTHKSSDRMSSRDEEIEIIE